MSLFTQLNAQGSVLRTALNGHAMRNEAIVNNIANADVPGFRARRVDFEDALIDAIGNFPNPRNRNVDTSGVRPTLHFQDLGFHFRTDGNNVDIEVEMVRLYQNQMRFDTITSSIMANSQRLRTIFQQ